MGLAPRSRLDSPCKRGGRARFAARLVGVLASLLLAGSVMLTVLTRDFHASYAGAVPVVGIAFAGVGVVVGRRRPRNPVGWLLAAEGIALLIWLDASLYSVLDYRNHGGRLILGSPSVFLTDTIWMLGVLVGPPAILLFPDGQTRSRRWRATFWVYGGLVAVYMAGIFATEAATIIGRRIEVDTTGSFSGSTHVTGLAATVTHIGYATGIAAVPLVLIWASWVTRQLLIFRRSTGEQREQLKCLIAGAAVCVISPLVLLLIGNSSSTLATTLVDFALAALAALPLSIGVGILKYRLYEIDRLISRTLSYLIITGLLAGVFAGIVFFATDVLPFSSPVAVAASTLAAAALFNPLRLRVQRLVDRRFNRARYDADAIITAFTLRLRDAVDLDTIRGELLLAVDRAVEPAHASLWIKPPLPRPHV